MAHSVASNRLLDVEMQCRKYPVEEHADYYRTLLFVYFPFSLLYRVTHIHNNINQNQFFVCLITSELNCPNMGV